MVSQPRYLIDTDWIIDSLHGLSDVVERLSALAEDRLAISLVSYGELYEGAYYAHDREAALTGLHTFLEGKELLTLSAGIMERFGIVRGALPRHIRDQVGDIDLLIAATALEHDQTLVTHNVRHFRHVPGLKLLEQ